MTEPLSAETLAQMRVDHAGLHWCLACETVSPCDAALLLAELDRREANQPTWHGRNHQTPASYLATLADGIAGLPKVPKVFFWPRDAEDLC